jgi:hypothetical protein
VEPSACTGDDIDPRQHLVVLADRDEGIVRVSFGDLDPSHEVTLTAKCGSRELVLFRDHRVGDLDDPAVWEHSSFGARRRWTTA